MFNPSDLLGSVLQGGLRGPSMGRLDHAMGERGLGGAGGPLGQILGQLGGSSGSTAHPGSGGGVLEGLARTAGQLGGGGGLGGGRPMGGNPMAGGLGALAGAILSGRARGMGGTGGGMPGGNMRGAVGAGGLAMLAMLAMNALKSSGQRQASGPGGMPGPADATPATPPDETVSDRAALLVLRAMIAAAKADGRIDATERQRITAKLQESGTDPEGLAFLEQEMQQPLDVEGLAVAARDPVIAAQVYAASLLAIQVDTLAEQAYLRDLARRLELEPGTVVQLHQALNAPTP